MGMVANVTVRDSTHVLADKLKGNEEAGGLDLVPVHKGNAALFKKGAHYSATDGHTNWKLVYVHGDDHILHFQIAH